MRSRPGRLGCAALVVGVALLAGCASAPTPQAMQVEDVAPSRVSAPGRVAVSASGGADAVDGVSINNADLKAAIEATLVKARAFEGVDLPASARYQLAAVVTHQSKPAFGASFTVNVEIGWSLTDRQDGRVLLRKVIPSEGTVGAFAAFAGVTRVRMATEAAVRANLDRLLKELSTLAY
jgi:hypothetical protein